MSIKDGTIQDLSKCPEYKAILIVFHQCSNIINRQKRAGGGGEMEGKKVLYSDEWGGK